MQITCLPHGLGPASRIFTNILKPTFTHLSGHGLDIGGYIDDSIICVHDDDDQYEHMMIYAAQLFDKLGFTINLSKSMLPPTSTKIIEHLGFIFNSVDMTVQLTQEKMHCIAGLAKALSTSANPTIQQLAQFVGKLVTTEPGFTHAPLFYKEIEIYNIYAPLAQRKLHCQHISPGPHSASGNLVAASCLWCNTPCTCSLPRTLYCIRCQQFGLGWYHWWIIHHTGTVVLSRSRITYQHPRAPSSLFHVKGFLCKQTWHTHIRLKLDNTPAVACINRLASTKTQLMKLTKQKWCWALERNIILSTKYLPGCKNSTADAKSRAVENTDAEWMISKQIFEAICDYFGQPKIDLFASRLNKQLATYYAWRPDPEAAAIDAFMQPWQHDLMHAFPPFRIIGRVLQKTARDQATIILVAPMWPTQAWFSVALRMLIATPRVLPPESLTLPQNPTLKHPLTKMRLADMMLSGNPSKQQDFLTKLSPSSPNHGEREPTNNATHTSPNGLTFVTKGKQISFRPLWKIF